MWKGKLKAKNGCLCKKKKGGCKESVFWGKNVQSIKQWLNALQVLSVNVINGVPCTDVITPETLAHTWYCQKITTDPEVEKATCTCKTLIGEDICLND